MSNPESKSFEKDQVVNIINSVMQKVAHDESLSREVLFAELQALKKVIDDARAELGNARVGDIQDKHIPTATDELDAIVEATAEATGAIMDSCESIQESIAGLESEAVQKVEEQVVKIFESCTFQDITGQRITKVVKTLKDIEEKVNNILGSLVDQLPSLPESEEGGDEDGRTGDEALLNGPQLQGEGISQEEIDKLLEDFD